MSKGSVLDEPLEGPADHVAKARDQLLQVMLVEVFAALDRKSIRYCILHGYQDLPHRVTSDVDMLIPAETGTRRIAEVFANLKPYIGTPATEESVARKDQAQQIHPAIAPHSRGSIAD